VDFRILGPVEVWVEGRPLALGGLRQRALLALLLMHAGDAVSQDTLVDELWAGRAAARRRRVRAVRAGLDRATGHPLPRGFAWTSTLTWAATVCAWLEDRRRAARLYELLAPLPGVMSPESGPVAVAAGRLAVALGDRDAGSSIAPWRNFSGTRASLRVMNTRLRTIARTLRAAHRRQSQQWIRRMEAPASR